MVKVTHGVVHRSKIQEQLHRRSGALVLNSAVRDYRHGFQFITESVQNNAPICIFKEHVYCAAPLILSFNYTR